MEDDVDEWKSTWCPIDGPDVGVDEDGCCVVCGGNAVGEGAEAAAKLQDEQQGIICDRIVELQEIEFDLEAQVDALKAERDEAVARAEKAESELWLAQTMHKAQASDHEAERLGFNGGDDFNEPAAHPSHLNGLTARVASLTAERDEAVKRAEAAEAEQKKLAQDLTRTNTLYDATRGRELCLRVNITEALGIDDAVTDEELYEATKATKVERDAALARVERAEAAQQSGMSVLRQLVRNGAGDHPFVAGLTSMEDIAARLGVAHSLLQEVTAERDRVSIKLRDLSATVKAWEAVAADVLPDHEQPPWGQDPDALAAWCEQAATDRHTLEQAVALAETKADGYEALAERVAISRDETRERLSLRDEEVTDLLRKVKALQRLCKAERQARKLGLEV